MNVIDVGRYAMAVTSSGILALALSSCAVRSSPPMLPSPATAEDAPPGKPNFHIHGEEANVHRAGRRDAANDYRVWRQRRGKGSYMGGHGGLVKATIVVMPGESLAVFVGGSGRTGTQRPFNGGGAGSGRRHHRSAGGGGASDVRLDTGVRIVIAGGGGGAGSASGEHSHRDSDLRDAFSGYGQGGDGGGTIAGDGEHGEDGDYEAAGGRGGGGGSQTAGGSGGRGGTEQQLFGRSRG